MTIPTIHLTDAARLALQGALAEAGDDRLQLRISERFEHELRIAPGDDTLVVVECGGVTLLIDASSAQRADNLSIDFVDGPQGAGFTIANPNEPPRVRQLSAVELKAMIDRGLPFTLIDVRTEAERAIAKIEGSRLLDREGHDYVMSLDRNTTLVFQCHHGIRSQSAAEYCVREGFRNLYNLQGGIDAWSLLVDPSVPRY